MQKCLSSIFKKWSRKKYLENKQHNLFVSESLQETVSTDEPEICNNCYLSKKSQAHTLPEGWIWTDYDDGSGCIDSPGGDSYFSYDLDTNEYILPHDNHYSLWVNPDLRMSLKNFKAFAELYIKEKILNT